MTTANPPTDIPETQAPTGLRAVLLGSLRWLACDLVVTLVTWFALVVAHSFDARVPVLALYAVGVLVVPVGIAALWIGWAIRENR